MIVFYGTIMLNPQCSAFFQCQNPTILRAVSFSLVPRSRMIVILHHFPYETGHLKDIPSGYLT